MKKLIFILFLFCSVLQAQTIWYIGPSGNDVTGAGTSVNPWRSFYHAINANVDIESGDKIYAFNGTYTGAQQISVPIDISIEGESMGGVIIECSYSTAGQPLFLLETTNGWLGTYGNQSISYLTIDGNNTTYYAIHVNYRSNVIIDHCTIRDCVEGGISLYGMDKSAWNVDNHFESQGVTYEPNHWTTGNKVTNCILTNNAGSNHGNISFGQQNGLEITNCTIAQPIKGSGGNCGGIKFLSFGFSKNTKITYNTISVTPNPANEFNFSLEMWYEMGNCEYAYNTLQGAADFDVAGKSGAMTYSIYFHHNICGYSAYQSSYTKGINIEATERDVIIDKNYFHHVAIGISLSMIWPIGCPDGEDCHSDQNSIDRITITNNKITNIGKLNSSSDWEPVYGINFSDNGSGAGKDSVKNVTIYNNTIVFGQATPDSYWVTGIYLPNNNIIVNGLNIKNNIIYGFDGASGYDAPIIGYKETGTVSVSNFNITYNDFYGNGNSNTILKLSSYPDPTTENNNITTDPLFYSDYHIPVGSPSYRTGTNVGLLTDYEDKDWASPPSRGAYELGTGGAVAPTVTTTSITEVEATTASSGGNVTSDGGASVTARGICWALTHNPTTASSKTTDGTGTGVFISAITGLTEGLLYYVKAYATNSVGTSYGNELSFLAVSGYSGSVVLIKIGTSLVKVGSSLIKY